MPIPRQGPVRKIGAHSARPRQSTILFVSNIENDKFAIGNAILTGIAQLSPDYQAALTRLFVLHEVIHLRQNITSDNYFGIGRAGIVLEQVDYAADARSLLALCSVERHHAGIRGEASIATFARTHMEAALEGIAVFDRMEHGDFIADLYERRLRRYLTWAFQINRLNSGLDGSAVERVIADRPIVEIKPTVNRLDLRSDVIVQEVAPASEIFRERAGTPLPRHSRWRCGRRGGCGEAPGLAATASHLRSSSGRLHSHPADDLDVLSRHGRHPQGLRLIHAGSANGSCRTRTCNLPGMSRQL